MFSTVLVFFVLTDDNFVGVEVYDVTMPSISLQFRP